MMKKVLLVLMVMVSLKGYSQIAISQLPTYTGNPSGGYVPIVIGGATKKIDAAKFTNGVALLASNNNFTGTVDTFTSIRVGSGTYGISSSGAALLNTASTNTLTLSGNAISTIGTDGTFASNNNNTTIPTQVAVKTYVDAHSSSKGYKEYRVRLAQSGTSNPTKQKIYIDEITDANTTVYLTRNATGTYQISIVSTNSVYDNIVDKVDISFSDNKIKNGAYSYSSSVGDYENYFTFYTYNASNALADGLITFTNIYIRVYP
jgi:hypothetical protein